MNNINSKLHYYQVELIKRLSQDVGVRFNDLIIKGLESEHMNYHLKKLIDIGFVLKKEGKYLLSDTGKDYFNLLDENSSLLEKQPKTSVIIHAKRKNINGEVEQLLTKRLRQPYYGKVGHPTGKVKFGEKLTDAVSRELFEETGLKSKSITLERVYRKMREKNGVWVQDVIFFIFLVTGLSGTLIEKTEFQENFWATAKDIRRRRKDIDLFDDFKMDDQLRAKTLTFNEETGTAEGF